MPRHDMAHKSSGSMAFGLCYDGAGHAQVSTAFILRGPLKVAARKQLASSTVPTSNHTARHLPSFSGTSVSSWFLPNSIGGWTLGSRVAGIPRKTSIGFRVFRVTCIVKKFVSTIVLTDKWRDEGNSVDSICIMD